MTSIFTYSKGRNSIRSQFITIQVDASERVTVWNALQNICQQKEHFPANYCSHQLIPCNPWSGITTEVIRTAYKWQNTFIASTDTIKTRFIKDSTYPICKGDYRQNGDEQVDPVKIQLHEKNSEDEQDWEDDDQEMDNADHSQLKGDDNKPIDRTQEEHITFQEWLLQKQANNGTPLFTAVDQIQDGRHFLTVPKPNLKEANTFLWNLKKILATTFKYSTIMESVLSPEYEQIKNNREIITPYAQQLLA